MSTDRYAVVSLGELEFGTGTESASLTDRLGCTDTAVDAHRLEDGDGFELAPGREDLCVQIDGSAPLTVDGSTTVPPLGVVRVPAGVTSRVRSPVSTTVLVVSAPAEPDPGTGPTVVDLGGAEFEVPSTSDVRTAHLTGPLGCTGTKTNARLLGPGQVVPYHTEGEQEELFVPLRGPAGMRIDDQTRDTPVGTVTRVAPPVPRSAVNDGTTEALWLMIGAPQTGSPAGWGPGAESVE